MARDAELRAKFTSTGADKVIDQAEQIADAADQLEEPITVRFRGDTGKVSRDIEDVLAKVDRLAGTDAATLTLTTNAAKIANEIADLTMEIDDLDAQDVTIDAKVQNIRDLEEGLDRLSAKAKEVSGQEVSLRTEGGRKGFDDIVNGADQANSAVANMVGNASQDMGELVGVTGSAGVAVGQLAEYFTDTAFRAKEAGQGMGAALGSFAAAAGPIAAISAGIFLVTSGMEEYQRPAKEAAERTKALGDAMAEGGDDALAFADVIRDSGDAMSHFDAVSNSTLGGFGIGVTNVMKKIPLLGSLVVDTSTNIYESLTAAGESVYSFADAIDKGGATAEGFRDRLQQAKDAGQITGEQFNAVSEALDNYAGSAEDAAKKSAAMAVSGDEVAAMLREIAAEAEPMSKLPGVWAELTREIDAGRESGRIATDAVNQLSAALGKTPTEILQIATDHMDEMAKAAQEAADNAAEYASVLSSDAWATSTVDSAATAWQRLGEQQFATTNIAKNSQAAYDTLNQSIKDNGFTFDLATEAGRSNAEQIQNLYSSLIPNLSAAFADSGGNINSFRDNMDRLRDQTFRQLDEQTDLTTEQIQGVISQLGVFDGSTYSSQFEMLGVEDANAKLALLTGVIGDLPEDVQRQVTLSILAGDPQAALDAIQASVSGGATMPLNADPSGAQATAAATASTIDGTTATMGIEGDNKDAKDKVSAVDKQAQQTKPIIDVAANIQAALITMAIINAIARSMAPTVDVHTNITPALIGLAMVAGQRPQVPVNAYLHDYPSAGEIAARIGVVRVPVDTYIRTEARITGVRE